MHFDKALPSDLPKAIHLEPHFPPKVNLSRVWRYRETLLTDPCLHDRQLLQTSPRNQPFLLNTRHNKLSALRPRKTLCKTTTPKQPTLSSFTTTSHRRLGVPESSATSCLTHSASPFCACGLVGLRRAQARPYQRHNFFPTEEEKGGRGSRFCNLRNKIEQKDRPVSTPHATYLRQPDGLRR